MAYVRGPTRGQKRALEASGQTQQEAPSLKLCLQALGKSLVVRGDTYELRTEMRAMGGEWNGTNKWWRFSMPIPPELLTLLQLDACPSLADGEELPISLASNQLPFTCSNGKALVVAKCHSSKSCHTCKAQVPKGGLLLGMNRLKTISRGANAFGDGSKPWSKVVDWTDWSHLDCFKVPKIMLNELCERYDPLGGWEMGVAGVAALSVRERELLADKCPPSNERITRFVECVKEQCRKLPPTLVVLVAEYVYTMDPDLIAELGAAVKPPAPINFSTLTVAQLKVHLKQRQLDATGTKKVLLERLLAA